MFLNAKKLSKVLIKLEANLEQIWSYFVENEVVGKSQTPLFKVRLFLLYTSV